MRMYMLGLADTAASVCVCVCRLDRAVGGYGPALVQGVAARRWRPIMLYVVGLTVCACKVQRMLRNPKTDKSDEGPLL